MPESYYNVYKLSLRGTPRDHVAIFVETGPGSGGIMMHVRGAVEIGDMYYERRDINSPSSFSTYLGKEYIGRVKASNVARLEDICESVTPPPQQFGRGGPIYPGQSIRRCNEWTNEVIALLEDEGILE